MTIKISKLVGSLQMRQNFNIRQQLDGSVLA